MNTYNYTDKTALLYVVTKIKTILDRYVKSESGKGLSTYDFSEEYKRKLDGIADEATRIIVDAGIIADSTNPVQGKAIYAELLKKASLANPEFTGTPTAPTAIAGTNSTQLATTAFVMNAIALALEKVSGLSFVKVEELPEVGESGIIYLVAKNGTSTDVYDEYFWYEGQFEYMGTTAMDLSGYVKATEMIPITTQEIDAMFADW